MLSFSSNTNPNPPPSSYPRSQYFTISNNPSTPNPPRIPQPKPKTPMRTVNLHPSSKPSSKPHPQRPLSSQKPTHTNQFSHNVSQPKLFDQRLKRGELAAEQRRIQNQLRKMNSEPFPQKEELGYVERKVVDGVKRRGESVQKREMERVDKEMGNLQGLIEKEKRERMKNDREFEEKAQVLNGELKKLKMIEAQMKKVRNPNYSEPQNYSNAYVNSEQPIANLPKHTLEHSIDGPEQRERKRKELALLMGRRQKLAQYSSNPLKHAPTLIPLLSKTSYRIISTHISSLTQLLIDDILLQQVLILEEIQEKQREKENRRKQKGVLQDYLGQVGEMVRQNDLIENRIGNYSKLDFFEHHLSRPTEIRTYQTKREREQIDQDLTLYLPNETKMAVHNNRQKFQKFRKYRDEYNKDNQKMFGKATQQLIQQILDSLVKELDKGSEQFVEGVFRNEFK